MAPGPLARFDSFEFAPRAAAGRSARTLGSSIGFANAVDEDRELAALRRVLVHMGRRLFVGPLRPAGSRPASTIPFSRGMKATPTSLDGGAAPQSGDEVLPAPPASFRLRNKRVDVTPPTSRSTAMPARLPAVQRTTARRSHPSSRAMRCRNATVAARRPPGRRVARGGADRRRVSIPPRAAATRHSRAGRRRPRAPGRRSSTRVSSYTRRLRYQTAGWKNRTASTTAAPGSPECRNEDMRQFVASAPPPADRERVR